jgi:hypothetical protein
MVDLTPATRLASTNRGQVSGLLPSGPGMNVLPELRVLAPSGLLVQLMHMRPFPLRTTQDTEGGCDRISPLAWQILRQPLRNCRQRLGDYHTCREQPKQGMGSPRGLSGGRPWCRCESLVGSPLEVGQWEGASADFLKGEEHSLPVLMAISIFTS